MFKKLRFFETFFLGMKTISQSGFISIRDDETCIGSHVEKNLSDVISVRLVWYNTLVIQTFYSFPTHKLEISSCIIFGTLHRYFLTFFFRTSDKSTGKLQNKLKFTGQSRFRLNRFYLYFYYNYLNTNYE